MALFKVLRGNQSKLEYQPIIDGYAWFCKDSGNFYIDVDNERIQLNSKYAEVAQKLKAGIDEIEIPELVTNKYLHVSNNGEIEWTDVPESIPSLVLQQSQIIGINPLIAQLTEEQYHTILNNNFFNFDGTALSSEYISGLVKFNDYNGIIRLSSITNSGSNNNDWITHIVIFVDKSTKQATVEIVDRKYIDEPTSEGTNGQVLTTDGDGGRNWTTINALPAVEGSGKALVSVNGAWVEQEGFPWKENPVYGPIIWDGDTTGKEIIKINEEVSLVKLSDTLPDNITDLIGGQVSLRVGEDNYTSTIREEDIKSYNNAYGIYVLLEEDFRSEYVFVVYENTDIQGIEIFKGVWSMYIAPIPEMTSDSPVYMTLLTSPAGETHKIDPTYLPDNSVEMIIHGTFVEESASSRYLTDLDVSYEDAVQAYLNGRTVKVEFVWNNRTHFLYASDYFPSGDFKSLLFIKIEPDSSSSTTIMLGDYRRGENRIVISWSRIEGLPEVDESDAGKILKVTDWGSWWIEEENGLPSQTGQNGKFLTTNGTAASWAQLPESLPPVTSADNGKVLAVVNGAWAVTDLQDLIASWNGGNF